MSFTMAVEEVVNADESGLLGIHESWERVTLGEVAQILNGFPFASDRFNQNHGTPLIRIRDVTRGKTDTFFNGDYDPTFLIRAGELLIGMDGDFNSAVWRSPDALLNQRVCKVTAEDRYYDASFLALTLPAYLKAINAATPSITVKHLSSRTISEIPLPLPPLVEQHRIVARVEELLSQIDAGVDGLRALQKKLRRYRAAVLKAACEGTLVATEAELARAENRDYEPANDLLARVLTERRARWEADQLAKMRARGAEPKDDKWKARYEEPAAPDVSDLLGLPEGWMQVTLGQLLDGIEAGKSFECIQRPATESEWGVIKVSAMSWGQFLQGENKAIPSNKTIDLRNEIQRGDLLLSRANTFDLVGASVLVGACRPQLLLSDKSMRLKVSSLVSTRWMIKTLAAPHARLQFSQKATGTSDSMRNISQDKVQEAVLALPPLAEQERIVAEVERRLSVLDQMEATLRDNLKRADRLRQAVLRDAFAGKLVPQDPDDEPAADLLARIRAERDAQTATIAREKSGNSAPRRQRSASPKSTAAKEPEHASRPHQNDAAGAEVPSGDARWVRDAREKAQVQPDLFSRDGA